MKVRIRPGPIEGDLRAPSSKSLTHRALFCALQAEGVSSIAHPLYSDDTLATHNAVMALGATVEKEGDTLLVRGIDNLRCPTVPISCAMSASTMRMCAAVAARAGAPVSLTGDASLLKRPILPLARSLEDMGAICTLSGEDGCPPIIVDGSGFIGGSTTIEGNISSQYLSGLMMACPKTRLGADIAVDPPLASLPYAEMTSGMLGEFGVGVRSSKDYATVSIEGGQEFSSTDIEVEGDYSSAAFMLVAGALCGSVTVSGLSRCSAQGDGAIVDVIRQFGGNMSLAKNSVSASLSDLSSSIVDCTHIPDLVPIIAVLATQAGGTSILGGIQRLKFKESDRVSTTIQELQKMGANIREEGDSIVVCGATHLHGACVESHNDHRIAMACAVAGLIAHGDTVIAGSECVSKSYPGFFRDLQLLGGRVSG